MSAQRGAPPETFGSDLGVVLALNAVSDACVVLDGPGCPFYRVLTVQGSHDWSSTLLSCLGHHRFQFSGIGEGSPEQRLRAAFRAAARRKDCAAVLAVRRSSDRRARTDCAGWLRQECPGLLTSVLEYRDRPGGWLDGYAAVLEALAQSIDLRGAQPRRENVAIVGHFMDRCEGDHRGNARELARLCRTLGLRVVSVWLSGGSLAGLRAVRDAGTIISLPHGRRAAKTLARRLKAGLIETGLPLGLGLTEEWMRLVASALGRRGRGEAAIARELGRVVPLLERVVPYALLNKSIVFSGDPTLVPGLAALCSETGASLAATLPPAASRGQEDGEGLPRGGRDLLIGNSDFIARLGAGRACLEFGYPSRGYHALREEPFLGFEGALGLLQRMANAMSARRTGLL